MPAQDPGADRIIDRQLVIGVIVTVDHQVACLGQQAVAVAAQVAQLDPLGRFLVFAGNRLDCLQCGLVDNTAVGEINDDKRRVILDIEQFRKAVS